jgi:hypothetical protein
MITRLGTPPGGSTGITLLDKFNDVFYMAFAPGSDLQAQAYEDWKYGTIPNVTSIVASQGSPSSVASSLNYTPLESATEGVATAKVAQTQAITNAENVSWFPEGNATIPNLSDLIGGIPWGNIILIGVVVLGAVVVIPMLVKK